MGWKGGVPPSGTCAHKITNVGQVTEYRGVITDWGGVLTTPILTTVQAWIQADEIDWDSYRTVMRLWVSGAYETNGSPNPIHALERGECSGAEFERILAARLSRIGGGAVVAEGLLQRMFAASVPVPAMYDTVRALRRAGFATALLSNSWGCDEYPRADFPGLFDAVVISGEVGMRKPEERIFTHAAQALGLEPAECVFIDDLEANVAAAVACGMVGVLHTDSAATAAALHDLLGVPLGPIAVGNSMCWPSAT
jgi:putative hydrolase of the HAD superfamily